MKSTLMTIGSRGDVQPFMALGLGLQKSGHKIPLATHATFEKEIRDLGMDFAPLEGDIRQLVETDAVQDVIGTGSNPFLFSQRFMKAATPLVRQAVAARLLDQLEEGGVVGPSQGGGRERAILPYDEDADNES